MVSKVRLVLSPNKKRNVKRPVVFEMKTETGTVLMEALMKVASKKLCMKAKGLYLIDGTQLSNDNVRECLDSKDGLPVIVTKKKGEVVKSSPTASPATAPIKAPPLRRRSSYEEHMTANLTPLLEQTLGASVVHIITEYASICPVFSDLHVPPTINFSKQWSVITRVAQQKKKWKEKSKRTRLLGWGVVQNCIHQVSFRIDNMHSCDPRLAVGIADPRYASAKTSQYGIGECAHSWGLGCDGMFRYRGRVIKLQDGQGRTPTWKVGDTVGIRVNPKAGKLAFFVGRKQFRVKPGTVSFPTCLHIGVSFKDEGDQITFLNWTEEQTMQYSMPKELRI